MLPKPIPRTSRHALLDTAAASGAIITGAVLCISTALADQTWDGDVSLDWNNAANWTNDTFPTGTNAFVNSTGPNVATISGNSAFTPTDIIVGNGTAGRLDHTAGTAQTGGGNWMTVGFNSGGLGTYNLADTTNVGGALTGYATGQGTMNVNSNLMVGRDAGEGIVNVNTIGNLNISGDLRIADAGDNSKGTLNLDSGSVVVSGNIQLAKVTGGLGSLNIGGGSISGNELRVGYGSSTGTVNLTSGSISTNNWTTFGGGGATGNLNMSGGSFTQNNGGFIIGDNGFSTFEQSAGNLSVGGEYIVGQGSGTGIQNFDGGQIATSNWVSIGRDGGNGTVTMMDGEWTHSAGVNFVVGATGTGLVDQSGGLIDVQTAGLEVGEHGTGTFKISGDAEVRAGEVRIGLNTGATGNFQLNGGTLRTHRISGLNREGTDGAGNGTVAFNGTQIIASMSDSGFITNLDTAEIQNGGLKVNSNGFALESNQVFTGTGNVVKTGEGSLSLNGNSNFSGELQISAGSLYVNGALGGSTSATVDSGGTIGGNGSLTGTLTVNGTVSPGLSVGELTSGNLALGVNGVYVAELDGNGVNDRLTALGSMTIDGMIQVFLNYTASGGDTFDIADFASFSGAPTFDFSNAPLEPGLAWDVSGFSTNGVISVVPEPQSAILGLLGAAGILSRRRRSQD